MTLLARILVGAAARDASRRATALYVGIAVVAAVLFGGPNGMHASDVTGLAAISPGFRVALWGVWCVAAAPVVDGLLVVPSTFSLRAWPVAAWRFSSVHGALALIAEVPWLVLWTRGAGLVEGAAATLGALALHAAWSARPHRLYDAIVPASLMAAIALAAPAPLRLALAVLGTALFVPAAWRRGPERSARTRVRLVAGPPVLALALAGILAVVRTRASLLARGAIAVTALGGFASLVTRNNALGEPAARALSLALLAPSLAIAGASVAGPLVRAELRDRWLLDQSATDGTTRVAATALGLALWLVPCALGYATLVAGFGGVALAPQLALAGAGGLAMAGLCGAIARWAERGDGEAGDRVFGVHLAWIVAFIALCAFSPSMALMVLALGVSAFSMPLARRAALPPRVGRRDTSAGVEEAPR